MDIGARVRELAGRSHNFGYLLPLEPRLVAAGAGAEVFVYTDPNVALIRARQFGEVLVGDLVRRLGLGVEGADGRPPTQHERINALAYQGAVTPEIKGLLHEIRRAGNRAAHDGFSDSGAALVAVRQCFELGQWFHLTVTGRQEARGFTPPKPGVNADSVAISQLHGDLERSLHRLEEIKLRLGSNLSQLGVGLLGPNVQPSGFSRPAPTGQGHAVLNRPLLRGVAAGESSASAQHSSSYWQKDTLSTPDITPGASTPEAWRLVQKLWSACEVLRDDGVSSWEYVEQIAFLLFLKIADERARSQLHPQRILPEGHAWQALVNADGRALELTYTEILNALGQQSSTLGAIFRKAQNRIHDPTKLKRLIVDLIDKEHWSSAGMDVNGDAYERLLERSAGDKRSGAGQYFTPAALVRAMVDCVKPEPSDTIVDPACGTGGFLVASYEFISQHYNAELTPEHRTRLSDGGISGVELVDATARLGQMNLLLHGIGRPEGPPLIEVRDALATVPHRHASVVLANPPFGRKSSITVIAEDGRATREDMAYERPDFWETTSNKQLNFVQHIASLLAVDGRAAVIVPDNVLFEGGAGEQIRRRILKQFDVHTLLRLPTGIFYSGGVKANVLFFDKKPASEHPCTKRLWVYDFRTGQHFTLKQSPLRREHLQDFVDCYLPGKDRSERVETERFRVFTYDELLARDKANLDIIWLKDPSREHGDDPVSSAVVAQEIVEDLEAALIEVAAIAEALKNRPKASTPPETQG